MRKNFVFALFFSVLFSSILTAQVASVVVTDLHDGVVESSLNLSDTEVANTKRLVIKKEDIPAFAKHIDIKFDFSSAKTGDDGYFVLSDGRLGLFKIDNGKILERRNPIPIFGMKKHSTAFVAIIKGMKYEFSTIAEVKDGVYKVYPRFHIAEIGAPVYEDIIIDVTFFPGEDANYSAMAREYRKYQLGRGEVRPLRERAVKRPELAYAVESMYVRFLMSQKNNDKSQIWEQTLDNEPPLRVFLDFCKTENIIKSFGEMGIKDLCICYVGWNSGGLDGRFPTLFPPEARLGGEGGMKRSILAGDSFGYQSVAHVCNTDFYTISARFDMNDIACDVSGKPKSNKHLFSGGRAYSPCFKQIYKKYIKEDLAKLKELGIRGLHHIDVTSCIVPWDCHSPAHPCTRADTAKYMNKIGLRARKVLGGFASEGPCDHVVNSLDYALYISAYPRYLGRENPMVDKIVPLWQIAYHGIILSNPFYSTIDPFYENSARAKKSKGHMSDVRERWLKIVEFGGRPTFYGHKIYDNLAPVKRAYDAYQKVKHLQWEFMDFHDEIAPNVFVTKYANGECIVSNYNEKEFIYGNKKVAPKDYILIDFSIQKGDK